MVRFDAYTATTAALKPHEVIPWVFQPTDVLQEGRGFHTFGHRVAVKDAAGDEVASVQWGGRHGDRLMFEVKGERTPEAVERLRRTAEHRCTRVDSCLDVERAGAFEDLLEPVMRVKRDHRLWGERRGDWEDQPELGRTYYLGSPKSPSRARLYEKGKQPELRHLNRPELVRLELQVRPQKDGKAAFARLSAMEVWGASRWTRQLAAEVMERHVDPHPPGTVRKETSRDRALRFMCQQYGGHLTSLAADLGGWDVLGLTLREMVVESPGGEGGRRPRFR